MTYLVNFKIKYISLIVKHLSDIFRYLDLTVYDFRVTYQAGTGERRQKQEVFAESGRAFTSYLWNCMLIWYMAKGYIRILGFTADKEERPPTDAPLPEYMLNSKWGFTISLVLFVPVPAVTILIPFDFCIADRHFSAIIKSNRFYYYICIGDSDIG